MLGSIPTGHSLKSEGGHVETLTFTFTFTFNFTPAFNGFVESAALVHGTRDLDGRFLPKVSA